MICKMTELLCLFLIIFICSDMNFRPYEHRILTRQILVKQCIHKFVNLRFV